MPLNIWERPQPQRLNSHKIGWGCYAMPQKKSAIGTSVRFNDVDHVNLNKLSFFVKSKNKTSAVHKI